MEPLCVAQGFVQSIIDIAARGAYRWDGNPRTEEMLMFVIDRMDARRLRGVSDPKQWHAVSIWLPRFVLRHVPGKEPRWTFVWFGEAVRRSVACERIGDRIIHRWVYQTDTVLAS